MNTRPFFELETYDDKTLPENTRLTDAHALIGHEVVAMITHANGRLCSGREIVIVTKTLCWMVIKADDRYGFENGTPDVEVKGIGCSSNENETLHDYIGAYEQYRAGLISKQVYDELLKLEQAEELKTNAVRAARLRAELAELEGGAS